MTWIELILRFGGLIAGCVVAVNWRERYPAFALAVLMLTLILAISLGVQVGIDDYVKENHR